MSSDNKDTTGSTSIALIQVTVSSSIPLTSIMFSAIVLDGYCSTVQDLLDWFEVDLGFTKLYLFR